MYKKRINLLLSDSGFTPVVDEPSSAKEYQWSSTISRLCIGGNTNWREHWRLESCLPKWQRLGSNYRSRGFIPQNGGLTEVPEYRLQTEITETQPFPGNMDYRRTTVLCVEVVFFKGDNSWLSLSLVCIVMEQTVLKVQLFLVYYLPIGDIHPATLRKTL